MKLIVNKDRTTVAVGTWGTQNENDYEILEFEFPEELENYNKRIVYYLGNERVWDTIVDNKAYLTNTITVKEKVKAYVWLTKENTERDADTDFRTKLFEMKFYDNDNADGIVPTEEQIDGFNTMLTAMNRKIDEVDALEQTIGAAETQRQENENTRISNESTRESNESTRQTNEETRQSQEADRERRTDEAIADIEDKTAEYNANAEAKTNEFNQNATQKTNEFNSNYTQKVNGFNSNATTQKTDFNSNASSKTSAFNSNAETKTNTFNTNATNKTNAFNSNATEKTTAFDDNASTKTSEFNTNAESKTTEFNTNATNKTNDFNTNASEKTDEFNTNAQEKIDEYDEHIVDYQAQIDELQEEVDELSENMPWNTTEQATEIQVTDAAKYSRNKLELFGNTEQTSYEGKNLLPNNWSSGSVSAATGNIVSYDSRIYTTNKIKLNGNTTYCLKLYNKSNYNCRCAVDEYDENNNHLGRVGGSNGSVDGVFTTQQNTKYINITIIEATDTITYPIYQTYLLDGTLTIMLEEGSEATDYEPYVGGQPSPNPDYPQPIHVVTGENTIGVQGKNLFNNITTQEVVADDGNIFNNSAWNLSQPIAVFSNETYTFSRFDGNGQSLMVVEYDDNLNFIKRNVQGSKLTNIPYTITTSTTTRYVRLNYNNTFDASIFLFEQGSTATSYEPYYHVDYPINLGNIELCKIGDYQDYLWKDENSSKWYVKKKIEKKVFDGTETLGKSSNTSADIFSYVISKDNLNITTETMCNYLTYANTNVVGSCRKYGNFVYLIPYVYSTATINEFKTTLSRLYENGNPYIIYYILETPTITQITDPTLIAQLEAIYNHLQLVKGTNNITVTAEDLAPNMKLTYMQDLPTKLDNLDSRLSLLE